MIHYYLIFICFLAQLKNIENEVITTKKIGNEGLSTKPPVNVDGGDGGEDRRSLKPEGVTESTKAGTTATTKSKTTEKAAATTPTSANSRATTTTTKDVKTTATEAAVKLTSATEYTRATSATSSKPNNEDKGNSGLTTKDPKSVSATNSTKAAPAAGSMPNNEDKGNSGLTTKVPKSVNATNSTKAAPAAGSMAFCVSPFQVVKSWCYHINNTRKISRQRDAWPACQQLSGFAHPITIETAAENTEATSFLKTNGLPNGLYFTDHYYDTKDKRWHYMKPLKDNGPNYATSFTAFQPSVVIDSTNDWCMTIDGKATWTPSNCNKDTYLLCELEQP